MKKFGLIGYPLGHSFSKKYFTEKFEKLGLSDHVYELFELKNIEDFPALWENNKQLHGINVTVPHKQAVMPFLTKLDVSAQKVGAVNVIKRAGKDLIGYNSDYYGFKTSFERFVTRPEDHNALILGGGGAARAVKAALEDLEVDYQVVSRQQGKEDITYNDLKADPSLVAEAKIIINTTPLGMHPKTEASPDIPYDVLTPEHYLYDLVYNPEETTFMHSGKQQGAHVMNGLEMLYLQADRAWEIWNE